VASLDDLGRRAARRPGGHCWPRGMRRA
jgi:hypothetical protein